MNLFCCQRCQCLTSAMIAYKLELIFLTQNEQEKNDKLNVFDSKSFLVCFCFVFSRKCFKINIFLNAVF